jgi:hypothetical protein
MDFEMIKVKLQMAFGKITSSKSLKCHKLTFDHVFNKVIFDHVFNEVIFDVPIILEKPFDILTLRCSDFQRSNPLPLNSVPSAKIDN